MLEKKMSETTNDLKKEDNENESKQMVIKIKKKPKNSKI